MTRIQRLDLWISFDNSTNNLTSEYVYTARGCVPSHRYLFSSLFGRKCTTKNEVPCDTIHIADNTVEIFIIWKYFWSIRRIILHEVLTGVTLILLLVPNISLAEHRGNRWTFQVPRRCQCIECHSFGTATLTPFNITTLHSIQIDVCSYEQSKWSQLEPD